jgi:hypothetical protein
VSSLPLGGVKQTSNVRWRRRAKLSLSQRAGAQPKHPVREVLALTERSDQAPLRLRDRRKCERPAQILVQRQCRGVTLLFLGCHRHVVWLSTGVAGISHQ